MANQGQDRAETRARAIARTLDALRRCERTGSAEWAGRHRETLRRLTADRPHGSGLDGDTGLDLERSGPEKLVFRSDFRHEDEAGGYNGWSHHWVVVQASLAFGLDVLVTGRDRNGIKDYLGDVWLAWLSSPVG